MPYFVFRITQGIEAGTKSLELQDHFEEYRQAKAYVRERRSGQAPDDTSQIRMVFAGSEAEAESRLREHREAPILREWEK